MLCDHWPLGLSHLTCPSKSRTGLSSQNTLRDLFTDPKVSVSHASKRPKLKTSEFGVKKRWLIDRSRRRPKGRTRVASQLHLKDARGSGIFHVTMSQGRKGGGPVFVNAQAPVGMSLMIEHVRSRSKAAPPKMGSAGRSASPGSNTAGGFQPA